MNIHFFDSFGSPLASSDLARSDDFVEDLFIETRAIKRFLGREPEYHVIVGSKGSGKSLLLFKKAVLTTKKSGIVFSPSPPLHAYTPAAGFAGVERWIPFFWELADRDGRPKLDQWAKLWLWALLAAVLHAWRAYLRRSESGDESLREEIEDLLANTSQKNPFLLISEYLEQVELGTATVRGKLILPRPGPLRDFVIENVNRLPPPYIFLDNQDDTFFEYPDFWKASGAGCFMAIQELHQLSNHRIHIFLTLRPEIEWELRRSQHWAQWKAEIFSLRWQDDELLQILISRARRLKRNLLPSAEIVDHNPLGAFLGQGLYDKEIGDYVIRVPLAEGDGQEEYVPLRDHILRHTFRRPREIILLGNAIIDARWDHSKSSLPEDFIIRDAIDETAAKDIAASYLSEIKHRWPWGDRPDESLREFITTYIQKNVLSSGEVQAIEIEFAKSLSLPADEVYPFRKLASFGLVGWPVHQPNSRELEQHFVLPGEEDLEALPGGVEWFLAHPALYAAPFFVRPVPGLVVGPGFHFPSDETIRRLIHFSCFICCGKPDEKFATRLYRDLRSHGVQCWLYVEDSVPGERIWPGIKKSLKEAERWIVICSVQSLIREGVLREIEEMVDREQDRIIPLSFDKDWRSPGFKVISGSRDLKPFLIERNLANFGQRGKSYRPGLSRLLVALARVKPGGRNQARF